jgi:excisionase family DNA binding protein
VDTTSDPVLTALADLGRQVAQLRAQVSALTGPKLVSVREAADVLGVAEVTVRRHVRAGKLVSKRVGRAVRVDLSRLG